MFNSCLVRLTTDDLIHTISEPPGSKTCSCSAAERSGWERLVQFVQWVSRLYSMRPSPRRRMTNTAALANLDPAKTIPRQSHLFVPELLLAPEIREFSRIRSFSGNSTENSTENSVLFQNWSKTPQKASKWYQNVEKAPEIAQNFYIFVKSTQKSSQKAPDIFKNTTELFCFCQKYPKKLPKSSQILERFQSGNSSDLCVATLPATVSS